jgi:hypothetical protein
MRVYVTYFRYDRGESYSIYHLDTSMRNSIKHWKEEDLPNFLGYGPDDVSQLYLIRCNLTKTEVEVLKESMTSGNENDIEFINLIDSIHKETDDNDIIYCTTGDENFDVLQWFQERFRWFINPLDYWETEDDIPTDEDELNEELQQILFDDEQVFDLVLKRYIHTHY